MAIDTKSPTRVLLVANRTAATPALLAAVRARALRGPACFHLVVPATPRGLHRVADPEDHGRVEAALALSHALPTLSDAAGANVTGHVGDPNPLSAVEDAVHLRGFDEIIVSTLHRSWSAWLRLDLPHKLHGLGLPVSHVEAQDPTAMRSTREPAPPSATLARAVTR